MWSFHFDPVIRGLDLGDDRGMVKSLAPVIVLEAHQVAFQIILFEDGIMFPGQYGGQGRGHLGLEFLGRHQLGPDNLEGVQPRAGGFVRRRVGHGRARPWPQEQDQAEKRQEKAHRLRRTACHPQAPASRGREQTLAS